MAESIVRAIGLNKPTAVDDYVYNGNFAQAGTSWYASAGNDFSNNRFEFKSPTFGDLIGRLIIPLTAGGSYVLAYDVVANAGGATIVATANSGQTGSIAEPDIIYEGIPGVGTVTTPFTATGKHSHIRFNAGASCIIDNISITVA